MVYKVSLHKKFDMKLFRAEDPLGLIIVDLILPLIGDLRKFEQVMQRDMRMCKEINRNCTRNIRNKSRMSMTDFRLPRQKLIS